MKLFKNCVHDICFVWMFLSILTSANPNVYRFLMTKEVSGLVFAMILLVSIVVLAAFHKWEYLATLSFILLLYIGIEFTPISVSFMLTNLYWALLPLVILVVLFFLDRN